MDNVILKTTIHIPEKDIAIDLLRVRSFLGDKEIKIGRKEFATLALLCSDPYRAFTVDELVSHGDWKSRGSVWIAISRIRKAFGQSIIINRGYTMYSLQDPKDRA